jgi:Tfp pilus assembly protein PilF
MTRPFRCGLAAGALTLAILGFVGALATARQASASDAPKTSPVTSSNNVDAPQTQTDLAAKEEELKEKLAKNPRDYETAYALANLYYDEGKRTEAEETYRKALNAKPDHVPSLVNLGVVLNEAGKSEEAITQFDKALGL